jgi:hypothetical protein
LFVRLLKYATFNCSISSNTVFLLRYKYYGFFDYIRQKKAISPEMDCLSFFFLRGRSALLVAGLVRRSSTMSGVSSHAEDRPWRDQLDGLLLSNEGKPRRERLTLIRVFEELRGLGYEGSYDAVRRYAKVWAKERGAAVAEAYVPLSFSPRFAANVDRSASGFRVRPTKHHNQISTSAKRRN